MSEVERRIDLAFEFVAAALHDPRLIDMILDQALVALGENDNAPFTADATVLLQRAEPGADRRRLLLIRSKEQNGISYRHHKL